MGKCVSGANKVFEKSFNPGLVLLTIIKLMGSDDVELSLKKWPHDIFLLGVGTWEDRIRGPPGGPNNFSQFRQPT